MKEKSKLSADNISLAFADEIEAMMREADKGMIVRLADFEKARKMQGFRKLKEEYQLHDEEILQRLLGHDSASRQEIHGRGLSTLGYRLGCVFVGKGGASRND